MTQKTLDRLARKLGKEELRGWLTPEGDFFESEETPAVRITGLTLGGHEQAALLWLESNAPELLGLLEERRIQEGYECWPDTDGTDMIKTFMFEHGFRRVAPE